MATETVFLRYEDDKVTGVFRRRPAAEAAPSWHFLDGTEPPAVRIIEHPVRR